MSDFWFMLTETGQLTIVQFSYHLPSVVWRVKSDVGNILSALNYEENILTVKTITGEIKKISIGGKRFHDLLKYRNPTIIEYSSDFDDIYTKYGFLFIKGEVMDHVYIKDYNSLNKYITLSDNTGIDPEKLFELSKIPHNEFYCMAGKLRQVDFIAPIIQLGEYDDYKIIQTAAGEIYVFSDYYGISNTNGKLMINGDSAIYITHQGYKFTGTRLYTEYSGKDEIFEICFVNKELNRAQLFRNNMLINIPDVVRVVQNSESLKIYTSCGKIHKMTLEEAIDRALAIPEIDMAFSAYDISHYVDKDGNIFDATDYQEQLGKATYKIEDLYYNTNYNQYPIIPNCKLPVQNGCLLIVENISKIGGTLIINGKYTILSKFAMDIANISLNSKSDIFSLKITTKKGDTLNAALFSKFAGKFDDAAIIFENGDLWPLVDNQSDIMYSPDGPYSRVPACEIVHLHGPVYIIRGNYVMFSPAFLPEEHPTTEIYKSFGNFMIKADKINIGAITIHKPHAHTKAAAALVLI